MPSPCSELGNASSYTQDQAAIAMVKKFECSHNQTLVIVLDYANSLVHWTRALIPEAGNVLMKEMVPVRLQRLPVYVACEDCYKLQIPQTARFEFTEEEYLYRVEYPVEKIARSLVFEFQKEDWLAERVSSSSQREKLWCLTTPLVLLRILDLLLNFKLKNQSALSIVAEHLVPQPLENQLSSSDPSVPLAVLLRDLRVFYECTKASRRRNAQKDIHETLETLKMVAPHPMRNTQQFFDVSHFELAAHAAPRCESYSTWMH
ncbi:hypothetical protein JCM3770_004767 [Rhodotorula araucariae]